MAVTRTAEVLGLVCLRDTNAMIRKAQENKRELSVVEIESCRERARKWGVEADVERLFDSYFESQKKPKKGTAT